MPQLTMEAAREIVARFEALQDRESRADGWHNILTGLGEHSQDHRLKSHYLRHREIDRVEIEAMYEQNPIFARIIDVVPEHATRRWIRVQGAMSSIGAPDESFGRSVLEALDNLDAQTAFYELLRLDRLDGGSAMIIGADDGQTPDQPLEMNRIRRVVHLNVLSRFELFPQERNNNPLDPNFRQPEYYTFSGTAIGTADFPSVAIHHSRVIRLTGIQTTLRSMNIRDGWGIPLIQRTYDAMRQFDAVYDYTETLFKDLVQSVMTIPGLDDMITSDQGNQALIQRMQIMTMAASAFNMVLLNEDEKYERRVTGFGGISEIMIRIMDKLAAVSEMPLSILFGQAPTGLSTDDKGGRTTFYDSIANKQKRALRNPIARVLAALIAAKEGPTKGKIPARWSFDFAPLAEPTETEKAQTEFIQAQAMEKLILNRVVTPQECRARVANEPNNPYMIDLGSQAAIPAITLNEDVHNQEGTNRVPQDPFSEEILGTGNASWPGTQRPETYVGG